MSGLEKIIGQIDAQAKADAAELLRCAQADAEELRSQAQDSCQAELAQIQERSTRDIAACRARAASALEQQRRMALLQTTQEIIGQMLQSALHTLQAEPADAYFTAVEKLVGRFARPQAGQIVFSQQDLDRMPENFAARLNAIAQEKGGALTLAPAGRVVGGGFILVYGGIEENCTFPALFEARKEELQDLVHKQLFA